jgi:hypothetical protein
MGKASRPFSLVSNHSHLRLWSKGDRNIVELYKKVSHFAFNVVKRIV